MADTEGKPQKFLDSIVKESEKKIATINCKKTKATSPKSKGELELQTLPSKATKQSIK